MTIGIPFRELQPGDRARIATSHKRWQRTVWSEVRVQTLPEQSPCCDAWQVEAERVEDGVREVFHRMPDRFVELIERGGR